ncbi:MAG: hypothetical protein M3R35_01670 [Candidatus Eremiobacteraeota bacterium]|nr:hypothetical protein [Candidatus Eremiobacteraeota bacterium]
MTGSAEAAALDAEILERIDAWHSSGTDLGDDGFNDLARRIFAYQLRWNVPYARYCAAFGITLDSLPAQWSDIPPVPAAAYKEAALATFDPSQAARTFVTSGTTQGVGGRHYMDKTALYDAASLAAFDRFALAGAPALRYFNLVPNPADRPDSSLGYMMGHVCAQRGDGRTGWYVRNDDIFIHAFVRDVRDAIDERRPAFIAATAFSLLHVVEHCAQQNVRLPLASGSRIMETGGFKGRTRSVPRDELYDRAAALFGIDANAIFAEYGMTELTSQYYDSATSRSESVRVKISPPWLRSRVVGPNGKTLPDGTVGALAHVDLANRSSCVAVLTEDLGVAVAGCIVLIGRDHGATLRGCSLDAEELQTALQ